MPSKANLLRKIHGGSSFPQMVEFLETISVVKHIPPLNGINTAKNLGI